MKVQSVIIPKTFTRKQSDAWILKHGYKIKKVDITENFRRYRQLPAEYGKKYHTYKLHNGIGLVLVA